MEKILLKLQNVYKGYGEAGTHAFRPVLKGLDLRLEAGQRVGIVGPSGCGKSTLLNMMGALDRPDQGTILFDGREISGFSDHELARFRNLELGFVFQQHHLLPQLTLMENVLLPLLPVKKRISAEEKNWAEALLKQTGIWEQRDQKPGEMSGGECQRAAVVRALINKPKLILADEPTGALDEENAAILADLLIGLSRKEGITLVSVTHAPEFAGRMNIVYQMQNGQLTIQE